MKFYDCRTAPSPRRVRMFIAEKGVDIPTVEVDLRSGEQLSAPFREINPYCTVPVLELDDGTRLTNTAGIWRYLEECHPDPALLGSTPVEKAEIEMWQWRVETDGFMAIGETLRNRAPGLKDRAMTGPHEYAQIPELAERGRTRAQRFLTHLDEILADREFLAGDRYSVADITALVTVEFAKWVKLSLADDAANVRRWYDAVSARPSAKV